MDRKKRSDDRDLSKEFDHNSKAFYLLSEYIKYVEEFKISHKKDYETIMAKFVENNNLADKIIENFNLVQFTSKEGELSLFFIKNDKEVIFDISELYERSDNSDIIKRYTEYLKTEYESLHAIEQREQDIRTKMAELKPGKPKKILGIFTDLVDKERVEKLYKKKKRRLESDLQDVLDDKEMLQFQIDLKEDSIEKYKYIEEFVDSLSDKQKEQIKLKYNELKRVFDIDRLYQMKLETLNSKIMPLSKYVQKKTNEEPKKVLFNLIHLMYYAYRKLPDNQKNLYFGSLSSYYNFGKYKAELDVLGKAMEEQEFGKINRYVLRELEREIEEANRNKEQMKKENEEPEEAQEGIDLAEME